MNPVTKPGRPMPYRAPRDVATVGRRALLRGLAGSGAAGGATALAVTLGATPATAAEPQPGTVSYGPAPSGGDDAPALQVALYSLKDGGTLLLQRGEYQLGALVYVPQRVDLRGSGGGYAGPATTLTCTSADAGLYVWGGGGVTGDFVVDAANTATRPFVRGYEGAAVGRTFESLSVRHSAQDGVVCLGGQNDAWYHLTVDVCARDNLVLDQGYGGALFSRCELATAGRFNLRIDKQVAGGPYPTASDLVFHQCIVEYTTPDSQSVAYINGGINIKFDHTSFFASAKTSGPVIDVLGGAVEITIEDAMIQSTGSILGGTGLRVDYGCGVTLQGTTHFQNFDSAIVVRRSSGSVDRMPWVNIAGLPFFYNCTNRVTADAATLAKVQDVDDVVSTFQTVPVHARGTSADDAVWISQVHAGAYLVRETAAGRRTWGPGDGPGDVSLGRRSAGVVGVDHDNALATGYGPAASRPHATAGALYFDSDARQLLVSDGADWLATTARPAGSANFTASAGFTVPAGVTTLWCTATGAGGGGGGAGNIGTTSTAVSCYGGAGGGAGMRLEVPLDVTPGEVLTVAVGSGGAGGGGAAVRAGSSGGAGAAGAAGGDTTVKRGATALVLAAGGGGGTAGPAAAAAPASGGAYGCNDVSASQGPGCGAFAGRSAVPAPGGLCGGASGASATNALGGASGTATTTPGARAVVGARAATRDGLTGANPTVAGCGGNGGGGGAKGGRGGNGGAGAGGRVTFRW